MDFITWAGIRSNRVNQLEPGPADVIYAGSAFYNGDDTIGFIYGYKDVAAANYRGTAYYTANRLDLEPLFYNVTPIVPIWKLNSVAKIIAALNDYYGLVIDPAEIAESLNSFDYTQLPQQLTITAVPDAMSCKGSIELTIVQKIMTLSDIVEDRDVDGILDDYPLSNSNLVLEKRYYNFDFTPFRATLSTVADPLDIPAIVAILNDADVKDECGNITWDNGTFKSDTFTFVYNGPTADYTLANPSYKYVLVISSQSPGTDGGTILMHYDA